MLHVSAFTERVLEYLGRRKLMYLDSGVNHL